jgi:hypothetical protein
MLTTPRRELTAGETEILAVIQRVHGAQNTVDEVFFTGGNEAVVFVKAASGESILMANLSNLAAWRADGSMATEEALEKDWLIP